MSKGGGICLSERNMSIIYASKLNNTTEYNTSFDRGVLQVCYVGQNRNNSFISKETFERCMKSIYNCPIVCRYDREADEIGAHDMEIVKDSDGKVSLINVTTPVGVIPESANYWWEEVEEKDGSIHEYLCVDALLWKRQDVYQKLKEDGVTDESMEITVKEGHMQDGIYVIDRFEFTAFCLLGTAEPCYESASLMLFSQETFKAQLDEMMREFKESFSLAQSSNEVVIHPQNHLEGGMSTLDEKKNLMAQYGITEDMIDFNLNEYSVEELDAKFNEIINKDVTGEPDPVVENFALTEQFRDELIRVLSAEKVETCFGEMNKYWYVDYDSVASEVYCYDQQDWNLYGFSYSMNGDNIVIDFESKKRKKHAIVDFDEGEQQSVFATVYSTVLTQYQENDSMWGTKYQEATESIASMEDELSDLREYKAAAENEIVTQKRNAIFDTFSDLVDVQEFEDLRENCDQYSLEDLEEKCYAIRGRNHTQTFSIQEQKAPKLPIEKSFAGDNEPYGGVFSEFGIKIN